jgi:type I restriction enzyme, S subunit
MTNLKPGWKRVVLGEIVDVVTDYWDRNVNVPERFVAGEHIDEGDLRVRRWGMTSDELVPPTFNRRFHAGDVLFHSRNLKKVACPDFAGITGEKLFVLRSKDPKQLHPELLSFILLTDAFNEYVNRMCAGSTNKFLNKAPLVKYDFALPPLEEQRRIASTTAAILNTAERLDEVGCAAADALIAVRNDLLVGAAASSSRPSVQLQEIADGKFGIVDGPFGSNLKSSHFRDSGTNLESLRRTASSLL